MPSFNISRHDMANKYVQVIPRQQPDFWTLIQVKDRVLHQDYKPDLQLEPEYSHMWRNAEWTDYPKLPDHFYST